MSSITNDATEVTPQLLFDNFWKKPWDVTHQYEAERGIIFELTKAHHHSYREAWEVVRRYLVMSLYASLFLSFLVLKNFYY